LKAEIIQGFHADEPLVELAEQLSESRVFHGAADKGAAFRI